MVGGEKYGKDRLIVALDTSSTKEAVDLIKNLNEGNAKNFKIGLEQYLAGDGELVYELNKMNKNIFLDLKFHDIPNTVAAAARETVKKRIWMFNMHVTSLETMKEGVKSAREEAKRLNIFSPLLVGVTVLTSLNEQDLLELYDYEGSVLDLVIKRAKLAQKAGLDGVVASPKEALHIKRECGENFLVICPGIRPAWSNTDDQKRVTTPKEAVEKGADYLVIGRPITRAKDPAKAASLIIQEINQSL